MKAIKNIGTVLVVEDNAAIRKLTVQYLMEEWPEAVVLTAPDGLAGFNIALAELPSVILMDWEMPRLTGIEALKKIRATKETANIPVIMYTGVMTGMDHFKVALKAGANEFLRKPADQTELVARINTVVSVDHFYKEKQAAEAQQLQLQLELKSRDLGDKVNELAAITLVNERKNTFLQNLLHKLGKDREEKGPELQRWLSDIISSIKLEMQSQLELDSGKEAILPIQGRFLRQILEKHPDLTKGEMKLCTLIRLNLSAKEIANTLFISPGAIEKKRHRLRKKLDLPSEASLENYIQQFSDSQV